VPAYRVVRDSDDPAIAAYRDIRERDLVGRQARFVAEGEVVLRVLVRQARFAVESCLIAENRLTSLKPLLAQLADDVPVNVAPAAVFDAVAGFPVHRGILAIGRHGAEADLSTLLGTLPPRALVVVTVGIANHDNIGGIFRNAAAFGADAVVLDETCCDPLYRKAIRVSVGGALLVPFSRGLPAPQIVSALQRAGFDVLALSPGGARPLATHQRQPRTAILLGAEGPGLSHGVMAGVTTIGIPMAGGFDSLNVATTSGIVLHHLTQ
jgi:tRNA G18 (ribose-2'-O)-methylase SpoU